MLLTGTSIDQDKINTEEIAAKPGSSLGYLFLSFLKVGATSWGGFMSLVAVIQKQLVDKDRVIDQDTILRGISLASVLPGPMAVNVVAFTGYKIRGIAGALISMAGVLLPCFVLMLLLSKAYLVYGNVPAFGHFFDGILPAVAAIIVSVSVTMQKKNVKDTTQWIIAISAAILVLFSKHFLTTILIIFLSGLSGYLLYRKADKKHPANTTMRIAGPNKFFRYLLIIAGIALVFIVPAIFYDDSINTSFHITKDLVYTFSGISLTQFGGGYVIIPSMQKIIVDHMHWLSNKEFTDAIAMGQVTPGPIFISAAFVGYKLMGFWGALIATIAIFLPAALLIVFCARFMERISQSGAVTAIFKGIAPAITGMIFAAAISILLKSSVAPVITWLLFLAVLIVITRFKTNPVYLIPLAGIAGMLIF